MQKLRKLLVLLPIILIATISSVGQTPTGIINGRVTDPNGASVTGAAVTITEQATNRSITTQTNHEGFFEARSLVPGEYSVTVEASGFSKATVKDVVVQTGKVADADVTLTVGAISNTVTIQGTEAQLQVDTSRSTVDGVVTAEKIQQLALNGRNFLDLASLQPSVRVQDGGVIDPTKVNAYRAVSVNGSS